MTGIDICLPEYREAIEKAAPGGAPTPAEGLTNGGIAPMADRDSMDASCTGAQQVGVAHG
jgi:hypothetical protein